MEPLQGRVSEVDGVKYIEEDGVRNGVNGCAQIEEGEDSD